MHQKDVLNLRHTGSKLTARVQIGKAIVIDLTTKKKHCCDVMCELD